MPPQKPGKSKQNYGTPPDLLNAIQGRFGRIEVDLAASGENTVADLFITEEINSLNQNWSLFANGGLCWLNPPFAHIEPWAQKCHESGARILFLVPASVGSEWYRKWVHGKAAVYFLNPRITFVGCSNTYPKDCLLAYYGMGLDGTSVWRWK